MSSPPSSPSSFSPFPVTSHLRCETGRTDLLQLPPQTRPLPVILGAVVSRQFAVHRSLRDRLLSARVPVFVRRDVGVRRQLEGVSKPGLQGVTRGRDFASPAQSRASKGYDFVSRRHNFASKGSILEGKHGTLSSLGRDGSKPGSAASARARSPRTAGRAFETPFSRLSQNPTRCRDTGAPVARYAGSLAVLARTPAEAGGYSLSAATRLSPQTA
jgi:hypothetical protein